MHPAEIRRSANVLGATVELLARDLTAATTAAAEREGGRAAALTALAGYASGDPIEYLASSLGLSHSRCVRIVDDLEADGLVERSPGATDRRTVCVSITRAGRAVARRITNERIELLGDEIEALGPGERAALDRICAKVLARHVDGSRAAARVCRLCDPKACGHPERCPVTAASSAAG
jgi:MarR family transcriptional regulator, negative regulator of the multidrug operon emrRAB